MTILVDLRCLNFAFFTGINTYTIHFCHQLWQLKQAQKTGDNFKVVSVGLHNDRRLKIWSQFPWLQELFDGNLSLSQYLGISIPISNKLLELLIITKTKFELSKLLQESKIMRFDYVLCPQPRPLPLNSKSNLILVVHDIFSILDNSGSWAQKLIYNKNNLLKNLNLSHKIVCNSLSTSRDVQNFSPQNLSKINLVYPGLPNLQKLQQNNSKTNSKNTNWLPKDIELEKEVCKFPYILAISGIEPRKNWLNLISGFAEAKQNSDIDLKLVLAGANVDNNYLKKLKNRISELKLEKEVIWYQNVSNNQKKALIRMAKFVIYPSFYEGFGFPILEAYDQNTRLITSNISSLPELSQKLNLAINPFNKANIAKVIELTLQDNQQNPTITNQNFEHSFSWQELYNWFERNLV